MNTLNPVRLFRDQVNQTQYELAMEIGVTRQVITNLESGTLNSLPHNLAEYIDYDNPTQVQNQYHQYQKERRSQNSHLFLNKPVDLGWYAFKYSVQPNRSHRGFCRKLLYQPSTLTLFETNLYHSAPHSLVQALHDVGLSPSQIYDLIPGYGIPTSISA